MGKRIRNKNKKKKESDHSTGYVNSDSSSSNNNNKNNDITIPTVATTTTTTIVLTTEELDHIYNKWKLAGYPRSQYFHIGFGLMRSDQDVPAIASFKRGADNVGCVPCMFCYVLIQYERGNLHLLLPYAFEGAIRGHTDSMSRLIYCYNRSEPALASELAKCWLKLKIECGDTFNNEEERKEQKNKVANSCVSCGNEDLEDNDVT